METSLRTMEGVATTVASTVRPLMVRDLGLIPYAECWGLQARIAGAVAGGAEPETLLLLEHPHTYTCGRRGGREHILIGETELQSRGVAVLDVDRGGDVTYHGPGQLVAYPVINLQHDSSRLDYAGYVRRLEEVIIGTLADFAINAHQLRGYSGVWVGDRDPEKIAAIGVKVDGRGITTHGIALNITTDLSFFSHIVPCGIADKGVTSMARLLTVPPAIEAVKQSFARHFAHTFGFSHLETFSLRGPSSAAV